MGAKSANFVLSVVTTIIRIPPLGSMISTGNLTSIYWNILLWAKQLDGWTDRCSNTRETKTAVPSHLVLSLPDLNCHALPQISTNGLYFALLPMLSRPPHVQVLRKWSIFLISTMTHQRWQLPEGCSAWQAYNTGESLLFCGAQEKMEVLP